jgi:death-on-curing protein
MDCYQDGIPVERIDLAEFLLIAEFHCGVDAHQLARMPRVVQLAESALAAPFAGYGEVELHVTLASKAAVFASRIVRYHPLPTGTSEPPTT